MNRRVVVVWIGAVMVCSAVVMGSVVWVAMLSRREARAKLWHLDHRVAADVEKVIVERLSSLGPEDEVYRRYGNFRSLSCTNRYRVPAGIGGAYISQVGWAKFEKAEVRCDIRIVGIVGDGPIELRLRMYPSEEWMNDHPEESLVKLGSVFKHVKGQGSSDTGIDISASHPEFLYSLP